MCVCGCSKSSSIDAQCIIITWLATLELVSSIWWWFMKCHFVGTLTPAPSVECGRGAFFSPFLLFFLEVLFLDFCVKFSYHHFHKNPLWLILREREGGRESHSCFRLTVTPLWSPFSRRWDIYDCCCFKIRRWDVKFELKLKGSVWQWCSPLQQLQNYKYLRKIQLSNAFTQMCTRWHVEHWSSF